jgi:hypothetical protein
MRSQKLWFCGQPLGGLLGFGVASYRKLPTGPTVKAAEAGEQPGKAKEGQSRGVFSPPGCSDSSKLHDLGEDEEC